MGKSKLIKYLISFFAILLLVVIGSRVLTKKDDIIFSIYAAQVDGDYLNKLLKRTPSDYKQRFKKEVLGNYGDFELINIIDLRSPIQSDYLVLKSSRKFEFLRAYPFRLLKSFDKDKDLEYSNHVSHLIDLNVFNKYITAAGIATKEDIIETYLSLLVLSKDDDLYQIVNSEKDIDALIAKKPLSTKETLSQLEYEFIDLNKLNFAPGIIYCWIYNKGIVAFNFEFDENGRLIDVNSEILGVLGNETLTW